MRQRYTTTKSKTSIYRVNNSAMYPIKHNHSRQRIQLDVPFPPFNHDDDGGGGDVTSTAGHNVSLVTCQPSCSQSRGRNMSHTRVLLMTHQWWHAVHNNHYYSTRPNTDGYQSACMLVWSTTQMNTTDTGHIVVRDIKRQQSRIHSHAHVLT